MEYPGSYRSVEVHDIGLIDYKSGWDLQEELFASVVESKIKQRNQFDESFIPKHHLILCEHPHVFTLGKSGDMKNLLASEQVLNERRISFFKINRGGDITYHGPGQMVGYPILDLEYFFTDIGKYLRLMEESIIQTLTEYGIESGRSKGETGVWLDADRPSRARKICAIGVRCSRWVTMHGFAFNVNTNLEYFNLIIPCGITNKSVTSMQKELGHEVAMNEVKEKWLKQFAKLYEANLILEKEAIA